MNAKELGEECAYPHGTVNHHGMTLRQHFAGLAMQGMAMRVTGILDSEVAAASVSIADALLAELAKDTTP